ncbi:MAG: dephospho-CoA kinase [Methylococcales bacterium]|nr:dephospho-CoA kinase [Methylococcales bacterium]
MLTIGLTGGIGSGKSTVSALFEGFNVPVIDADIIAHQLVSKGQPTLKILAQTFGTEIINVDNALNRARLKQIIFSNAQKKKQLENILHPLIYQQIERQQQRLKAAYCIISIPLLIETAKTEFIDRILVVDCALEIQIARIKQRDKLNDVDIDAIIASQASREERLAVADDVIDNSTRTLQLRPQVEKLHTLYLLLSSTQDTLICE